MSYATPADLIIHYDPDDVADCASNVPGAEGDVINSPIVIKHLAAASGRINAAAIAGGIYTAEILAALTGDAAEWLTKITCDLAYCSLISRRPGKYSEEIVSRLMQQAEGYLDLLRSGKNIFATDGTAGASVPAVDGPTALEYERLNLFPDRIKNTFPNRGRTLPIGRASGY